MVTLSRPWRSCPSQGVIFPGPYVARDPYQKKTAFVVAAAAAAFAAHTVAAVVAAV